MSPGAVRRRRLWAGRIGHALCAGSTLLGVALLGILLVEVCRKGLPWLDLQFLTSFPSRFPEKAGIQSALMGTLWVATLTALLSVPLGLGAAIYLEEYGRKGRLARWIEINILNLAGVPSIVFGILGLAIFVRAAGFGRSVLAGSMTLALLVLPVVIIAARESLRAVPGSIRQAAFALGATRWQVVRAHVLPAALPGILTGVILSLSRATGETAPLIMLGALTYVAFNPSGLSDPFTVLPIQIFNWAERPRKEFHELASAGILVLLAVLLSLNASAIWIRHRAERRHRW